MRPFLEPTWPLSQPPAECSRGKTYCPWKFWPLHHVLLAVQRRAAFLLLPTQQPEQKARTHLDTFQREPGNRGSSTVALLWAGRALAHRMCATDERPLRAELAAASPSGTRSRSGWERRDSNAPVSDIEDTQLEALPNKWRPIYPPITRDGCS